MGLCFIFLSTDLLLENPIWVEIGALATFIREFSELKVVYYHTFLNPAQFFVESFLLIPIFGANRHIKGFLKFGKI